MRRSSAHDPDVPPTSATLAVQPFDDRGHVEPAGPAALRRVRHAAATLTVTKLSVGPMDNNCYVVSDAAAGTGIVIDAADEPERILAAIGDIDITAVLTTHGHADHWQALAAVARATSARVLHHPADAQMIPVPADGTLAHGDIISVGAASVEVRHTPGHTDGSVCVVLSGTADDQPDHTTHIFTGDTLFPGGPGKTTSQVAFTQIMASLRSRLFTLDDDTWVHPGHGDDTTLGAERPHLDTWEARGW
jgi:glyoxylase-like metal-dependent hydrolase (beta-lactamase superfamily II)